MGLSKLKNMEVSRLINPGKPQLRYLRKIERELEGEIQNITGLNMFWRIKGNVDKVRKLCAQKELFVEESKEMFENQECS